jgi:hypothetical protein
MIISCSGMVGMSVGNNGILHFSRGVDIDIGLRAVNSAFGESE